MKKEAKEKIVEKSKCYKTLGFILSVISITAVVAGWLCAFLLPIRVDGRDGLANIIVGLLSKKTKENYVFFAFWFGVCLLTLAYTVLANIDMLKNNTKKSGNVAVCFTAGMIALFYMTFKSWSIIFNVKSLGYSLCEYAMILSLVCYLFYQYAGALELKKIMNIKGGKKFRLIPLLSIGVSVITLILVFFVSEKLGKGLSPKVLYNFAINCEPYTIFYADFIEYLKMPGIHGYNVFMKLILNVLIIVELFRTIAALIFDIFRLGFDEEYNYQSEMFNKTLPINSAMRFALIPFIYGVFQFTIDLYHRKGFKYSLKNISVKSFCVFIVVLALAIGVNVMSADKKKDIKEDVKASLNIGKMKKTKKSKK